MWIWPIAAALAADEDIVRLVRLLDDQYLDRPALDPAAMLRGAARAVADDVPWLICRDVPDGVVLHHGDGRTLGSLTVRTLSDLPAAVDRLATLLEPLGATDVVATARDGLTRPLDPYTLVLAGEQLERFDSRVRGSATEVGLRLLSTGGQLAVADVVPGSPAERAGLRGGDVVLRIDGHPSFHMPVDEAHRRLRGPDGSTVRLTIRRDRRDQELVLGRAVVLLPEVRWDVVAPGIGRLRVASISQLTVSHVRSALLELAERGALDAGFVLDLRGNTGGSLRDSALIVDLFVRDGVLLRTEGRHGPGPAQLPDRIVALDDGQEPEVPIVVLIDEHTASGAEIVAGGLVGLDRAVLIGTRSWGKGTVQKTWPLASDDVRVKMTVARFVLPGDRVVGPEGLAPDQAVARLDGGALRLAGWADGATWRRSDGELWQVDEPGEVRDVPLALATRTLSATVSAGRADLLAALRRATVEARAEETHRLAGAMLGRADWRPAPEEASFPNVAVRLAAQPAGAGRVVLSATVSNHDDMDLGRAVVALQGGPFDGVLVPLGWIAPGQSLTGTTSAPIGDPGAARTIGLWGTLLAEGRPALALPPVAVDLPPVPEPDLRVAARLLPIAGERRRIEVTLANGGRSLRDLDVHLAWPGDLGLRLLDMGANIPALEAGAVARVDLGVAVAVDAPDPLPVTLVVEHAVLGTLFEAPLALSLDGAAHVVVRPSLSHDAPQRARFGTLPVTIRATDDDGVRDLGVRVDGNRVAWAGGGRPQVQLTVEMTIRPGPNALDLWTRDAGGAERTERVWIWGEQDVPAVASP